jgi:hypothetical protein
MSEVEVIHFAISTSTACGTFIIGSTVEVSFDELVDKKIIAGGGINIQHTSDPEEVTCKSCQKTNVFKACLDEM